MRTSFPRTLLLLLVVVLGIALSAGGPVHGQDAPEFVENDITEDTTWTPDEGPYRIVSDIEVTDGATLSIDPGTTIQVAEGVTLGVNSSLVATGTPEEPVRFTSPKAVPTRGSWDSIETVGTDGARIDLNHATIEYATTGLIAAAPGSDIRVRNTTLSTISEDGIRVEAEGGGTSLRVSESTLRAIDGDGIRGATAEGASLPRATSWTVWNTDFESISGNAVSIEASTVRSVRVAANRFRQLNDSAVTVVTDRLRNTDISANSIESAEGGIEVDTASSHDLTVSDNRIRDSGVGVDVLVRTNVWDLVVTDNRITESRTGVHIRHDPAGNGFYSFGTTIAGNELSRNELHGLHVQSALFSAPSFSIHNNTLAANGWYGAAFGVGELSQATIQDNQLRDNGQGGLSVSARHIRSTAIRGNLVRGNTGPGIDLDARQEVSALQVLDNRLLDNAAEGLSITNGVSVAGNYTIRDNLIAANAYGVHVKGPQTSRIEHNEIVFNTYGFGEPIPREGLDPGVGVLVEDGTDNFRLVDNDIYGHRIGLFTDTGGTVEAEDNFWGSASGAYHQSINPEGSGDTVVTARGWVDIIYANSERVGTAHTRPEPTLSIDPQPAHPGDEVTISGPESTALGRTIETYRFTIDGSTSTGSTPTRTVSFGETGQYPVSLLVEDDLGIESASPAKATIDVQVVTTTTTTTTTTPTTTTTAPPTVDTTTTDTPTTTTPPDTTEGPPPTTSEPPSEEDQGFVGAMLSIGGILGAGFYLLALVLGALGMYQTVTREPLTVNGRRIQILAATGIVVWAGYSVIGPDRLLQVSLAGLVIWLLLTGVAFVVARQT